MSTLAELPPEQKQKLMLFLGAQLRTEVKGYHGSLFSPVERAAELKRWAALHKDGPGLPDTAIGRDAIYD